MAKRDRVKAGTNKPAAAARRKAFVAAYIANGRNGTQAAITAGYSPKTAKEAASRLLADVNVRAMVDAKSEQLQAATELTVENILREVARVALFDPAKLFNDDGTVKCIKDLDPDTRAAIASFEADELRSGDKVIGTTSKLKLWDKNSALEKAMRHLGLFEKDNKQRLPVHVEVELLG